MSILYNRIILDSKVSVSIPTLFSQGFDLVLDLQDENH